MFWALYMRRQKWHSLTSSLAQWMNEWINQSINQSINQPTNQYNFITLPHYIIIHKYLLKFHHYSVYYFTPKVTSILNLLWHHCNRNDWYFPARVNIEIIRHGLCGVGLKASNVRSYLPSLQSNQLVDQNNNPQAIANGYRVLCGRFRIMLEHVNRPPLCICLHLSLFACNKHLILFIKSRVYPGTCR